MLVRIVFLLALVSLVIIQALDGACISTRLFPTTVSSYYTKSDYSNNEDCNVTIQPSVWYKPLSYFLEIEWYYFSTRFDVNGTMPGCTNDYVEVYLTSSYKSIGRYCSNNIGNYKPSHMFSYDGNAKIRFHSDSSITGTGFKLRYRLRSTKNDYLGSFVQDAKCDPTSFLSRSGYIYSSGYPNGYQKSPTPCLDRITTAENRETRFTFMDLDLSYYGSNATCNSTDDYVEVRGSNLSTATFSSSSSISGKLCGTTSIKIFTTRKKYIFIYFQRPLGSLPTGRRGFTMGYIFYDVAPPTILPPTTLPPTTLPPTTLSPTTLPSTTLPPTTLPPTTSPSSAVASTTARTDISTRTTFDASTRTTFDASTRTTSDPSTTTVDGPPDAAGAGQSKGDGSINLAAVVVPVVFGILLIVVIIAIYRYKSRRGPFGVLPESHLSKDNPYNKGATKATDTSAIGASKSICISDCSLSPSLPSRPNDMSKKNVSGILGSENSAFEETPPTKTPDVVRKERARSGLSSDSSMKPIASNPGACGNSGLSKVNISGDNAATEKIGAPRIADKVEDGDQAEGNTRKANIEMTRLEATRKDFDHDDKSDGQGEIYWDLSYPNKVQVGETILNPLYEEAEPIA
eukprot:gene17363-19100_t